MALILVMAAAEEVGGTTFTVQARELRAGIKLRRGCARNVVIVLCARRKGGKS